MITIRHARATDEAGILRCLAAAFEPFRSQYSTAGFEETVLAPEALRRRMSAMDVFVAETEGEGVIGTIAAGEGLDGAGQLRGMAVAPAWQGRGVGRMLLRRAVDELVVAGCLRVTLGTTEPLVRASRLYESAGFVRHPTPQEFFGMPLAGYERSLDLDLEIRTAAVADAPAILRIVNAAYVVEQHFVHGDRLSGAGLREHFERGMFLVALRDGTPIACIFLQHTARDRMYLGLLAVDPVEQGRGIGRIMMSAAERHCRAVGARAIDIKTVDLRAELPPFYRRRGFEPCGTEPFEDARLFKPAQFVIMTLRL